MRPALRLLACALAWSAGTLYVAAQDSPRDHETGSAEDNESLRSRSRSLAIDAQVQFQAGEADAAIELLIEARSLYPEPRLLYNLARVYDAAGDNRNALDSYQRYVQESPDAEDRAAVDLRIEALRRTIAQLDAPPTVLPRPEPSGPGAWPWIVTTTGAAILVAGAVTGGLATYTHRRALDATVHEEAVPLAERADRFAVSTSVLLGVGGAVSGAGLIWLVVRAVKDRDGRDLEANDDTAAFRVLVAPTGVSIGGAW